ncbi:hypothetical protein B0T24DRAFT_657140 [Lasiosphaeria ovina]|uniref:Woronin body major protein n=1 Tax=Lasiosphaeria ovina TaxID=92902 RepID=A0AAE0KBU5_9PEZI|nr:hypothetical protein B0T24DRAFT_657140 [Lasiosphaeria ovina]
MGYYDEDGHYHSFRTGLRVSNVDPAERAEDVGGTRESRTKMQPASILQTRIVDCREVRLGDILVRYCQVIRISLNTPTGKFKYTGVDLHTKMLCNDSSFINQLPSGVAVQSVLGPILKQYHVLDVQNDNRSITAMTDTGIVKQRVPVLDQSSLVGRLSKAFQAGRGSVVAMVVCDQDSDIEVVVNMKVVHGLSIS